MSFEGNTVTIPSGTVLSLKLSTAIASDTSRIDDAVRAELSAPVTIDGRAVLPAGTTLSGVVMDVTGAGGEGQAAIAIRFTSLTVGKEQYGVETARVTRIAPLGRGGDAVTIAKRPADAVARLDVRLAEGANVMTQLTVPFTVRVGTPN